MQGLVFGFNKCQMRKSSLLSFIFICWILLSSFHLPDAVQIPLKKINKTIAKLWKDKEPNIHELNLMGGKDNLLQHLFVVTEKSEVLGYIYVGRVNSCRSGGCSIESSTVDSEYFDYFFIVDTTGKVLKVKVYNYRATHGHEIMSSGWLRQFIGYDGQEDLVYGKDIQAISGATVSALAINTDIQDEVSYLKEWLNQQSETAPNNLSK